MAVVNELPAALSAEFRLRLFRGLLQSLTLVKHIVVLLSRLGHAWRFRHYVDAGGGPRRLCERTQLTSQIGRAAYLDNANRLGCVRLFCRLPGYDFSYLCVAQLKLDVHLLHGHRGRRL